VDISTTPKVAEPAVKATVTEDGDVLKVSNAEVEVKVDGLETKEEAGYLKPELLDVKESRVASLKRNLSFSKMKKMFSRGEAAGAEVETKEGVDDVKVEVTSDEVEDAKDEAKEEEVDNKEMAVPEDETAVAEGDSKVTEWKNSLFKMFSRESADNEAATASTKEEGAIEEVEGAGDGLKTEEGLEEKKAEGSLEQGKAEGGESKITNLKKRLSFKAIKSRFTKEKKEEEEEVTPETKSEDGDVKEEVKTDGDEEAIKVASDGAEEMEPPTEAPPAVPVPEEDANAKNAQPGETSEVGTMGENGTPNDNTDIAVEGAIEGLAAETS